MVEIPETGESSRAWNRQEFVAKQLCRADGRSWDRLPNISTLWFRDRMHYRALACRAIAATRLWDANLKYRTALSQPNEEGEGK